MEVLTPDSIKTYWDLIQFIVQQLPQEAKLEETIGKHSPISWGTYSNIKRGEIPGENTKRKIRGYMESQLNLTFKEIGKGQVQVVKRQIYNIAGDMNVVKEEADTMDIKKYLDEIIRLSERVRVLERENSTLKEKLKL